MNLLTTLLATTALVMATSYTGLALGDDGKGHDHGKPDQAKSMPTADAEMTNAEVRKVDKDSKKITLKHEAIKSLDMPGMTMVFQVKDAALLDKAQPGDKVKVKIIQDGSAYIVTEIQPIK
jgi:Cu(I)/Ag(I) efflux system periplasmic protein CusF